MFRLLNLPASFPTLLTRRPFASQSGLLSNRYPRLSLSTSAYRPLRFRSRYQGPLAELNAMWRKRLRYEEQFLKNGYLEKLEHSKRFYEELQQEELAELARLKSANKEFSRDVSNAAIEMKRLKGELNPCTLLKHIATRDLPDEEFPSPAMIQRRLDNLAKGENFKTLLKKEVKSRGLVYRNVMECVHKLYDTASKLPLVSGPSIIVRSSVFAINERAALVAFLKLQDLWGDTLDWEEEKLPNEGRWRA